METIEIIYLLAISFTPMAIGISILICTIYYLWEKYVDKKIEYLKAKRCSKPSIMTNNGAIVQGEVD